MCPGAGLQDDGPGRGIGAVYLVLAVPLGCPRDSTRIIGTIPLLRPRPWSCWTHAAGWLPLSDGQIVVLALVWLFAFVRSALPPELHAALTDSYTSFAIALAITWRIRDRAK